MAWVLPTQLLKVSAAKAQSGAYAGSDFSIATCKA